MKNLLEPFPLTIFGVNVTIPAGVVLYWLFLAVFNITLWLTVGAVVVVQTLERL